MDIVPSVKTIGANSDQFSGCVKNILGNSRNERASTQKQISTSFVTVRKCHLTNKRQNLSLEIKEKQIAFREFESQQNFLEASRLCRTLWNEF